MRRRRSKSVQPGVSLFPFLAVLICTLGVLIVLLVLAVQSATIQKADREQTVASSEADEVEMAAARAKKKQRQQEVIAKLEDEIDLHILQTEGFESDRPKIRREVAKARDHRAHLESEIAKIEEQARQLVEEMKLLDSDLESPQLAVNDDELKRLNDRIEAARTRLIRKRENVEVIEQKKYAIVPYHGTGGTKRIPIFVECNRSGLVLQPWGIRLSREDFFHPVAAGNPVDAALTAVRNYYQKHELSGKDQRPYPLLVVRPDGAQSYGLARRSLISWDDEFGYELVSQGKDLDFGVVDPQLQQEIQLAVSKAKQTQLALKKRRAMMAGARRGGSGQGFADGGSSASSGGMRSSSQRGGFVREGGTRSQDSNQQVAYQANGDRRAGQRSGENTQIASSFKSATESNAASKFHSESSASSAGSNAAGSNSSGTSSPASSLANARGANWALPTQTSGATGYVRPVSLICTNESLTIRNVAGQSQTIAFGAKPTEAIDKMVNVIWQRIDAWGIAGSAAYWKPSLVVDVKPNARHRFEMLKQMLRGSGLGIEEVSR